MPIFNPSAASGADVKQTEIDFGPIGVAEASFTIVDADVSPTSQIIGGVAYEAPSEVETLAPEWTEYALTGGVQIVSICWSPELSLFVGVSNSNAIVTSSDGVTWSESTTAWTAFWKSVVWSSELSLFVAVGQDTSFVGAAMYSSDGTTWTLAVGVPDGTWAGVAWSPELTLFVAVGLFAGPQRAMSSPDGVTWTVQTAPAVSWRAVCWSPEQRLFVAVGLTTNTMITSVDGVTWISRGLPETASMQSVCWSLYLGLFVAVGGDDDGGQVMSSPDGIDWTWHTSSSIQTHSWSSVVWSPELLLFVAAGYFTATPSASADVIISQNGRDWAVESLMPTARFIFGMAWSPELEMFAFVDPLDDVVLTRTLTDSSVQSKDLDELDMDGLDLKFAPGSGQFTLYARALEDNYVADTFKINYLIG